MPKIPRKRRRIYKIIGLSQERLVAARTVSRIWGLATTICSTTLKASHVACKK